MKPTLQKSLRACLHPAVLAAVAVFFLNDHFFRQVSPSWWTGKMSDFAWLFLVPFPLAVLIAWLLPPFPPRHRQFVILIALALPALVFSLAKTLPAAHSLLIDITQRLLSAPVNLRRDPTDLIALPVLALSWWAWNKTAEAPLTTSRARLSAGWILLPLTALLTIANVGAPDLGVECLSQQGDAIVASVSWRRYTSEDGGLTWQSSSDSSIQCESRFGKPFVITDQSNNAIQYRVTPDEKIERSADGGTTWKEVFTLSSYTAAEEAYFIKNRPGNIVLSPMPLDGIVDTRSGNAIFSMGQQGVLVATSDGQWQWVQVGDYQKTNFRTIKFTWTLLMGELFLAVFASILAFASMGLRLHGKLIRYNLIRLGVLLLGWFVWVAAVLVFPPAMTYGYLSFIPSVLLIAVAIISLPAAIEALVQYFRKSPLSLIAVLPLSVFGGFLFFLPYFLWSRNTIPSYYLAAGFAMIMVLLVLVVGLLIKPIGKRKTS